MTSDYGKRVHPISGKKSFHDGIDLAPNKPNVAGDWVPTVRDGKVFATGTSDAYGNYVVIDHGNGVSTTYNHLIEINVQPGQLVTKGQVIGFMGTTGNSTGVHLHYMVINTPSNPSVDWVSRNPLMPW
jgi:murein DD-endopeptidase MepM/ murein hydrolase activator NlpD